MKVKLINKNNKNFSLKVINKKLYLQNLTIKE